MAIAIASTVHVQKISLCLLAQNIAGNNIFFLPACKRTCVLPNLYYDQTMWQNFLNIHHLEFLHKKQSMGIHDVLFKEFCDALWGNLK